MKELCWSLWKQRWAFLAFGILVGFCGWMFYLVLPECSVFEMCYRMAFVLLQMVFLILQRERFHIVLRKDGATRFYRSMPHAWEKEQKRFLWLDLFGAAVLAVLLAAGVLFQDMFSEALLPFAMVVCFLVYMAASRIMACVPYVWWVLEIVFAAVFIFVPALDVTPLLCGGTAVVAGIIQWLLYRFVKKLWESEN
ncbi:MAG: hypothetical protein E7268_00210 [Lachnospiraceae bacterium]|nr:hypothetical protein [Lachnospiraceae bacterium]